MRIKLSNNSAIEISRVKFHYTNRNMYIDLFDCQLDIMNMKHLIYNHGDRRVIVRDINNYQELKLEYFTIEKIQEKVYIIIKFHELVLNIRIFSMDDSSIIIEDEKG